jgi:hypothetical protein
MNNPVLSRKFRLLNSPPWHKHQPHKTGKFPMNEDDIKNRYKLLSAVEGNILFGNAKHIGQFLYSKYF